MKNVPGRRTDWHECQWLQYLHSVGLLRAAFRPEAEVCAVRAIVRHRGELIAAADHLRGREPWADIAAAAGNPREGSVRAAVGDKRSFSSHTMHRLYAKWCCDGPFGRPGHVPRPGAGERISKVCAFPIDRVDPDRYHKILAELIYPPPHGVRVVVYENAASDSQGVAAIIIDPAFVAERPYLVGRVTDENEVSIGAYFGYFERKRDFIPPVSIAKIQQQLSAGLQWASIHERLSAMETKIDALTPSRKAPSKTTTILRPEREMRIKKARITVGRDDAPLIYFDTGTLRAIGITADDDFAIAPRTGFGRGRAHCDLRKITRTGGIVNNGYRSVRR